MCAAPFPEAVTVGSEARLLGGSCSVGVGTLADAVAPRPRSVAKTGAREVLDLILAPGRSIAKSGCQDGGG